MARSQGRIGIMGTGSVGTSLATGFADAGHEVLLGSRDPSKPQLLEWLKRDPRHRHIGTYKDAAAFGEFVIVAVPGRVLNETLDGVGRDAFAGAVLIDATNPIGRGPDGDVYAFFGDDDSGAEYLQRELPDVPVVKAFNQINAADMLHPERASITVVRVAGDDELAKRRVTELLEGFGWTVRDLGPLSKARALEHGVVDWVRRSSRG